MGCLVKRVISNDIMFVNTFGTICFFSKFDNIGGSLTFFVDNAVALVTNNKGVSYSDWFAAACTILDLANNKFSQVFSHLKSAAMSTPPKNNAAILLLDKAIS